MDFRFLNSTPDQETVGGVDVSNRVDDVEVANPFDDKTTQNKTFEAVLTGDTSAYDSIQHSETFTEQMTLYHIRDNLLYRSNGAFVSIQPSEIIKEANKHAQTIVNIPSVSMPCGDSIPHMTSTEESMTRSKTIDNIVSGDYISIGPTQHLITTKVTKTYIKTSGNIVPEDNRSIDSIKQLTTIEENICTKTSGNIVHGNNSLIGPTQQLTFTEEKMHTKTSGNIVSGDNSLIGPTQHLTTIEEQKTNYTTTTSDNNAPGHNLSTDSFQHLISTVQPKTFHKNTSDHIVHGDNPSFDSIQHLINNEGQKISHTKITADIVPADNPSSNPIQHAITSEEPTIHKRKTSYAIPGGNPSPDPTQHVITTEEQKTNYSVVPGNNLSTDHTQHLITTEDPKTRHKKASHSVQGGKPSSWPKTLSKASEDPSGPTRLQNKTMQLNDNAACIWTPACKDAKQFSRLRSKQPGDVWNYTSDGFSRCRKLHNKESTALKPHNPQSLNTRSHTFSKPLSKKELELALPRKSSFSCHERALREAGYEVHANATDERSTRLAIDKPTLASEAFSSSHPTESRGELRNEIKIIITDISDNEISKIDKEESEHAEAMSKSNEKATLKVPEVEKMAGKASDPTKLLLRNKRPETANIEFMECKPLRKYLEYIKENEQEYLKFEQTSRIGTTENSSPSSLLKLGRAFELRNNGGKMKPHNDPLLVACRALRPRTADLDKFNKYRDTEILITDPSTSILTQQNKRYQDKNAPGMVAMPTVNGEVNPKSELEKLKQKAEEWCKSVPTSTVMRAKFWSLKELGIDDMEVTNWSQAFKSCGYIRQVRL